MEGSALRQEREYDLAIAQAYHGAKFGALAQAGKLKALSNYIGKKGSGKSPLAAALNFMHNMKASGVPVEISRVVH
jgi:hypothetical protein